MSPWAVRPLTDVAFMPARARSGRGGEWRSQSAEQAEAGFRPNQAAGTLRTLLVVTGQQSGKSWHGEHPAAGWHAVHLHAPSAAELRARWATQPPSIFLGHADALEQLDPATLQWMRRRAPGQIWLLAGQVDIASWLDFILAYSVQGWFAGDTPDNLGGGLQAVLRGETWFSRDVQALLYRTLLSLAPAPSRPGPAAALGPKAALTPRESQTIELVREGMTNKEIARQLQVSVNSVKKYLKSAFDKHGIKRRRQCFA